MILCQLPQKKILSCFLFLFLASFAAASVSIQVNGASYIRTITESMYGGNLTAWDVMQNSSNTSFNNLLKASGRTIMRWPGGSWGNVHLWSDMRGPNNKYNWKVTYAQTLNLLNVINHPGQMATPTLQPIVNFPGYWYTDAAGNYISQGHAAAVAAAVAWVQDQSARTPTAEFWEIGNEIGGPWEEGWFEGISGTYYGDKFADFYLAMKAVNPNIKIGACAEPYHGLQPWGWYVGYWTFDTLTAALAKGAVPDYLIIHQYPGSGDAVSYNPTLLSARVNDIAAYTATMDGIVANVLGPSYVGRIGYAMTEWDSGQPDNNSYERRKAYVNAMFHAQYIMEMARQKWILSNAWAQWEYASTSLVYPVWYVHPMLINWFGREMVAASSSNAPLVRAYAAKTDNGDLTLFIVNNSPTASQDATVSISGFAAASNGLQWRMEPAGSLVTGGVNIQCYDKISINGVVHPDPLTVASIPGQPIEVGNEFSVTLPASAMMIVKIPLDIQAEPDDTPPTPNPMSWAVRPCATGGTSIRMEATTASDFNGVEYYFACTFGGGNDSGWQTSPVYEDTGLTFGQTYTYSVKARDLSANQNETLPSVPASAILSSATFPMPITIANYSFEQPSTVKQTNWTNVPGWNSDTTASNSGVETGWSPVHGSWTGFLMGADPSVWNLTEHAVAFDQFFELLFYARNNHNASAIRATLYYDNAGQRIAAVSQDYELTSSMQTFTLSFSVNQVPSSIGRLIGIEFDNINGEDSWLGLDNVQLFYSVVPSAPAWRYGDFDGNHRVDADDLPMFADLWLLEDCLSLVDFDLNGDCTIGLNEFAQMARNWMMQD